MIMEARFTQLGDREQRNMSGGCILCTFKSFALWMADAFDSLITRYNLHGWNTGLPTDTSNPVDSVQTEEIAGPL